MTSFHRRTPARLLVASLPLLLGACSGGRAKEAASFSYPAPEPFLVGKPIAPLAPLVSVPGASYSVTPALPSGLALDAATGVFSGRPTAVAPAGEFTVAAATSGRVVTTSLTLAVDASPTVHLEATAAGAPGDVLTYAWRSTDGRVTNVRGAKADWILPRGPGIHFAYVLVGNGKGGYTERRVAVSTDDIGTALEPRVSRALSAPPGPAPANATLRTWALGGRLATNREVWAPDLRVYLERKDHTARSSVVTSGLGGEVLVHDAPLAPGAPSAIVDAWCSLDGASFSTCNDFAVVPGASSPYYRAVPAFFAGALVIGSAVLADGSPCAFQSRFFDVESSATVRLLDGAGAELARTRANAFGDFALRNLPGGATVAVRCEGSEEHTFPLALAAPTVSADVVTIPKVVVASAPPAVSGIAATFGGGSVALGGGAAPAGLPSSSGAPFDRLARPDAFLAYKGLDSRRSACEYYRAIGAASGCGPGGELLDPITYDEWRRATGMDPPPGATATAARATYVNAVDLNLTRRHESVRYGPDHTTTVVCNHLGPPFGDESAAAVDRAVDDAERGRNLVACVAMDYMVSPGVNGDAPFTRFLVFGPDRELLSTVNLDGRAEKAVPGVCVACHGGDRYAGAYPVGGSGFADIGAHFLPYDSGNFLFSTQPGLTKAAQAAAVKTLNLNLLDTDPTPAARSLVLGWYAGGGATLDESYVPATWPLANANGVAMYREVIARSCRTCHVALRGGLDFEASPLAITSSIRSVDGSVCGQPGTGGSVLGGHAMPNALVTFDRFWLSATKPGGPDQPAIVKAFMNDPEIGRLLYFVPGGRECVLTPTEGQ